MSEHVDAGLEGCRRGDARMVLSVVADDFVCEDARAGRFTREEFVRYLEERFPAESTPDGLETIADVAKEEKDGVYSERVAHYIAGRVAHYIEPPADGRAPGAHAVDADHRPGHAGPLRREADVLYCARASVLLALKRCR